MLQFLLTVRSNIILCWEQHNLKIFLKKRRIYQNMSLQNQQKAEGLNLGNKQKPNTLDKGWEWVQGQKHICLLVGLCCTLYLCLCGTNQKLTILFFLVFCRTSLASGHIFKGIEIRISQTSSHLYSLQQDYSQQPRYGSNLMSINR